jgi:hypothetical protein
MLADMFHRVSVAYVGHCIHHSEVVHRNLDDPSRASTRSIIHPCLLNAARYAHCRDNWRQGCFLQGAWHEFSNMHWVAVGSGELPHTLAECVAASWSFLAEVIRMGSAMEGGGRG